MPPRMTGARLGSLLDTVYMASDVWANMVYRSKKNETVLVGHGFASRVHVKKPKRKPMPDASRIANVRTSRVRSRVEHVLAR